MQDVVPDGEKASAPGALDDEATSVSEEVVLVAEEKDVTTATEEEMAAPMRKSLCISHAIPCNEYF